MSMVPVVASADELPEAIRYAEGRPQARWYVAKRAAVFGREADIPSAWGEAVTTTPLTAATAGGDLSTDQLAALGKKGQALKNADGSYSYPTRNRGDLANAFQAFGRGKNKVALKRYLLRRARALHSTDLIPDSWKPLRAAATVTADEVGLWVAQVRDLIKDAGFDPDDFEAGTDGFETDYREYQDNPQGYVDELVAAQHEPGDDDDETDDGEQPTEPEQPSAPEAATEAPAAPTPVAAAVGQLTPLTTTTAGTPYVNVYTAPQPAQPQSVNVDVDALVAAMKTAAADAAREAVEALTAAKAKPLTDDQGNPVPPGDTAMVPDDTADTADTPDTSPADDSPVDVDAAKQALRDRFGSHKPMKRKPPKPVAASVTAMRERIASRTTG